MVFLLPCDSPDSERQGGFFVLKRALMLAAVLGFSGLAAAQNPKFTIFAGYSYGNTNYGPGNRSNLNGWEASIEGYHLKSWLTLVADGSAHYGWNAFPISCVTFPVCTPAIPNSRAKEYTILGGPQISKHYGNLRPFVHLFGGATRVSVTTPGFFDSSTNWTVAGGGGVDYKWRGPFSLRVSADYLRTNLFGLTQNMVRGSTGFVVSF
jgi:hypothetical protein